jgi:hypothetical protein
MFHLVTTCVCRLLHLCIHDLVDPQPVRHLLLLALINIGEWCRGVTAVKDKIYIGGYNKVLILNTDGSRVREITTDGYNNYNLLLVVLINCMESSPGRAATALSVHGTTVIPQGSLVNDISSS